MTDKPTPTDAELKAMWQIHAADIGGIFYYARAVLAKWGQPAQAAEPVAWLRNTTDPQPHAVTNLKYRSAVDAKAGVEYIPVFAAPQPVEREPLIPREIELIDGMIAVQLDHAMRCDTIANRAMADKQKGWDMERVALLQKFKAAHGIKGGQHGNE